MGSAEVQRFRHQAPSPGGVQEAWQRGQQGCGCPMTLSHDHTTTTGKDKKRTNARGKIKVLYYARNSFKLSSWVFSRDKHGTCSSCQALISTSYLTMRQALDFYVFNLMSHSFAPSCIPSTSSQLFLHATTLHLPSKAPKSWYLAQFSSNHIVSSEQTSRPSRAIQNKHTSPSNAI